MTPDNPDDPDQIDVPSVIHAVRLVLIERCIVTVEARCERQAALVAGLTTRGEDTRDAEAALIELERAVILLEATQARLRAEQERNSLEPLVLVDPTDADLAP